MTPPAFGVYLHVPFCAQRCDYCAFATWTDRAEAMEAYVDAVVAEIARAKALEGTPAATTLFVGGGTPSLLPPGELARMIAAVELAPGAEVSVECNPESVSDELFDELVAVGVTRISLGVQSLVPRVLDGLGRHGHARTVTQAVEAIGRAGFSSFNVDLVYGGAGERDEDWRATLEGVLALDPRPPHISAYALTVEPGTPLWSDPSRHPDDDVQAARYEYLDETLTAAGYQWYELSNFALPGHECRHNADCWRQADYRGFGCAAHSHLAGRRFANVWHLDRYLERIASGGLAIASEEVLGPEERAREALELSVRTSAGVPLEAIAPDDLEALDGLLERRGDRLVLTTRGRMLANEVVLRLRTRPSGHSVHYSSTS